MATVNIIITDVEDDRTVDLKVDFGGALDPENLSQAQYFGVLAMDLLTNPEQADSVELVSAEYDDSSDVARFEFEGGLVPPED